MGEGCCHSIGTIKFFLGLASMVIFGLFCWLSKDIPPKWAIIFENYKTIGGIECRKGCINVISYYMLVPLKEFM